MDFPDFGLIKESVPVPNIFHSWETQAPFQNCLVCNRFLLGGGVGYIIEKAFKKDEVIFEYAICLECNEQLRRGFSKSSLTKIAEYFSCHVDLRDRRERLLNKYGEDSAPWLSDCVITCQPVEASQEYQICGQCDGEDLLFTYLPYALSGEAVDEIIRLLSKETKGKIDDFTGDYLGLPSGVRELSFIV